MGILECRCVWCQPVTVKGAGERKLVFLCCWYLWGAIASIWMGGKESEDRLQPSGFLHYPSLCLTSKDIRLGHCFTSARVQRTVFFFLITAKGRTTAVQQVQYVPCWISELLWTSDCPVFFPFLGRVYSTILSCITIVCYVWCLKRSTCLPIDLT
jgi:hypothetical protein